jgi:hypothetical protein
VLTEQIAVTLLVTDALEALGAPYAIGGSFASATHGVMRATMDADLVARLRPEHAEPLAQALGEAFYADVEAMRDAIRRRASFNVIHLETMFKVDIFVAKARPFDRAQLSRRQRHQLSEDPERYAYVASPEDNILSKLEWYRMGGGISDRQWRDVLSVLKVQGDRLDLDYLRRMAATLDVLDLLERALKEADEL